MTNSPSPMSTGPDGIAVMHAFEDCILHAYPDPASPLGLALQKAGRWQSVLRGGEIPQQFARLSGAPWTAGWGDTGPDVVPGTRWTQQQADERFARRLAQEFEPAVRRMVKVAVSQRQFDALVAWTYNVGASNAASSTLIRVLNAGDFAYAASEFLRWNKAQGRELLGLRRRRTAEQALFRGKTGAEAVAIGKAVQ